MRLEEPMVREQRSGEGLRNVPSNRLMLSRFTEGSGLHWTLWYTEMILFGVDFLLI
jgi:hypothetical protein